MRNTIIDQIDLGMLNSICFVPRTGDHVRHYCLRQAKII